MTSTKKADKVKSGQATASIPTARRRVLTEYDRQARRGEISYSTAWTLNKVEKILTRRSKENHYKSSTLQV